MNAVIVLPVAEVREVFAKVLSDFKIPYTRVPVEAGLHSCSWLMPHLQNFYTQVEKDALDSIPVFTRYGIRSLTVIFFFFFFLQKTFTKMCLLWGKISTDFRCHYLLWTDRTC